MEILKEIYDLATKDYNQHLEAAKKDGKKIIGYFCSYVPEEILHAAGMVPYRMSAVGSTSTTDGDIYFSSLNCTFVRHCFDKALKDDFHFIDGIVFMNGCDHTRRMYDNWRHADIKPDFRYMFVTPHVTGSTAEKKYKEEIVAYKQTIEKQFNVSIPESKLKESIKIYNRKRSLLAELYERRKQDNTPIKGSEVLALMLAITTLPVEKANEIIEELLDAVKGRNVASKDDLRVFLSSGCIEEIEHLELIENSGAVIVSDNICLGARHFDRLVDESIDPLDALAARYLNHMPCPRMMNESKHRLETLHKVKKDYNIDALIVEKLKFCDLWGGEMYLFQQESKKHNYPMLALERELYGGDAGQMRTRIQAFFEQVRNKRWITGEIQRFSGDNYKAVV